MMYTRLILYHLPILLTHATNKKNMDKNIKKTSPIKI